MLKSDNWIQIITILVSTSLSLALLYGVQSFTKGEHSYKLESLSEQARVIPELEKRIEINKLNIHKHIELSNHDVTYLKDSTQQLQKSMNAIASNVRMNSETSRRVLDVFEGLNSNINNLNITMSRIDERLKNMEKDHD